MIITKRPKNNKKYLLNTLGLTNSSVLVFSPYKKLVKSFSGVALKITRSSDSTSMNIYFLPNGSIDWNTMESFVGSGDCYIDEVYLQTLGIKAYNTGLNSTKPRAIIAGVRQTDGLYFDGSNDEMQIANYNFGTSKISWHAIYKATDTASNRRVFIKKHLSGYSMSLALRNDTYIWNVIQNATGYYNIDSITGNAYSEGEIINSAINYNGADIKIYKNSILLATISCGAGGNVLFDTEQWYIGSGGESEYLRGYLKRLILTNSDITQSQITILQGG